MNQNIQRIYQHRVRASRYNRTGFSQPFSSMDLEAIQTWLNHEREADTPDIAAWKILFTNFYPFYKQPISGLLEGQTAQAIIAGADPIESFHEISVWDLFEEGLQLLLENLDLTNLAVFDAKMPVFIDVEDLERAFWLERRMENGTHGEWIMSRMQIGSDQVFYVLIQSWNEQKPKAENARKICCDLLQACLDEDLEKIQGTLKSVEAPLRAKTLP